MVQVKIRAKNGETDADVCFLEACNISITDMQPCIDLTSTDFDIKIIKTAMTWPYLKIPTNGLTIAALMNFADYIGHESLLTNCAKAFVAVLQSRTRLSSEMKAEFNMLNFGPQLIVLDHASFQVFDALHKIVKPCNAQYKDVIRRTLQHNRYTRSKEFRHKSGAAVYEDLVAFQEEMTTNPFWITEIVKQAMTGAGKVRRVSFTPDCKRLVIQYLYPRKVAVWYIGRDRIPKTHTCIEIQDATDFDVLEHDTIIMYCKPMDNSGDYLRITTFGHTERDRRISLIGDPCVSIEMRGAYLGMAGTHEYGILRLGEDRTENLQIGPGQIRLCDHGRYAVLDVATSTFSIRKINTHETRHSIQLAVPATRRLIAIQISRSNETIVAVFNNHVACYDIQSAHWSVGVEVDIQGLALISSDCRYVVLQVTDRQGTESEVQPSSIVTYHLDDGSLKLLYKLDLPTLHYTPLAISPDNKVLLNSRQKLGGSWSTTIQMRDLVTGQMYGPT